MAKKVKESIVPIVSESKVPLDYSDFPNGLKSRIQTAQLKAAASVNLELTSLYWDIGQAIAFRFTADGSNIVIVSKDSSAQIQETIEGIESTGGKALALEVNVRSNDELKMIVSETVSHFVSIDILVNNTSAPCFNDALHTSPEQFDLIKRSYYAL